MDYSCIYDRGVTFFDIAESMGRSLARRSPTRPLAPMRDQVVIATTFGFDITP